MTVVINSMGSKIFNPLPEGFTQESATAHMDNLSVFLESVKDDAIIVFDGGEDVSPELYGEKNLYSNSNSRRDTWEANLWHLGRTYNIPMLGICRGSQFMCVMAGGSLYQDLRRQHPLGAHNGKHHILITADGEDHGLLELQRSSKLVPGSPYIVNSYHHQAERDAPADAVVLARHMNNRGVGVVEALSYPYGIAVQWHPEYYGHVEFLIYMRDVFITGEGYNGYRRHYVWR